MRDLSRRLVNVPAMTFREFARRLGISHALAQLECATALEKLRAVVQRKDFR
jgi:predicted DNA-binding protein (UPF0251 family)